MRFFHTINQFNFATVLPSRPVFRGLDSYAPPPAEPEAEDEDITILSDEEHRAHLNEDDEEPIILSDQENEAHLHGEDPAEAMTAQTKQEGEKTWTGLWKNMKKAFGKSKLREVMDDPDTLSIAIEDMHSFLKNLTYEERGQLGKRLRRTGFKGQSRILARAIGHPIQEGDVPNRLLVELLQLTLNKKIAPQTGHYLTVDNKFGDESHANFDAYNDMLHGPKTPPPALA